MRWSAVSLFSILGFLAIAPATQADQDYGILIISESAWKSRPPVRSASMCRTVWPEGFFRRTRCLSTCLPVKCR